MVNFIGRSGNASIANHLAAVGGGTRAPQQIQLAQSAAPNDLGALLNSLAKPYLNGTDTAMKQAHTDAYSAQAAKTTSEIARAQEEAELTRQLGQAVAEGRLNTPQAEAIAIRLKREAKDLGGYNVLNTLRTGAAPNSEAMWRAQTGAQIPMGQTAMGYDWSLRNDLEKQKAQEITKLRQTDAEVAGRMAIEGMKPTNTFKDGRSIITPQSESYGQESPPTEASVKGGFLQKALQGANNGQPMADPFANLPPRVQKEFGVYMEPATYVDPRRNQVRTVTDGTVPGGDFVKAGPETGVNEVRGAILREQAGQPSPSINAEPLQGDVAQDAYKSTGAEAGVQSHANALLGSLGITKMFGAGEIGPEYEAARSRLNVLRQTAKAAFINSPTMPLKEQKFVDEIMPDDRFLANPVTEGRKVEALAEYLKDDNGRLRSLMQTAPDQATLSAANKALIENEKVLRMLVKGAPSGAAPAAPVAQQPAGAVERWERGPDGRPRRVQ
jgi:hypothetical protein